MTNIRRQLLGLGFIAGSSLLAMGAAHALNGESNINVDGGPLGQLEMSGGVDGFGFVQSNSKNYTSGVRANAMYMQLEKDTGIVQFTVIAGHDNGGIMVGYNNSSVNMSDANSSPDGSKGTSILNKAYITIAPPGSPVTVSGGILPGFEGYESGAVWNDVSAFTSALNYVTSSNQIGANVNVTKGPASLTVQIGDVNSTHVFNTLELNGVYTFNSNNVLTAFGTVKLGRVGEKASGVFLSQANYSGTQSDSSLYSANANAAGAYYSWTHGNLNVVPEVQYLYAKVDHQIGINKANSNLGLAVFGDYSFANTPYSLGSWIAWDKNTGGVDPSSKTSNNPGLYAYNPNDESITFAVAPTWQYKYIYARLNGGYVYLLNRGYQTSTSNSNWNSTKRGQFMAVADTGFVF